MLTEQYRQEAEERYASLLFSDDFLFCKILTENEDITKELLELILDIKISSVRVNKCKCQYKNAQKVENKNVHFPRAIPQPVFP